MIKCCIKCSVSLEMGNNIHDFCVNKKWYLCKSCHDSTQNGSRMYVDGRYVSRTHPLHKPGRYVSFNDAAFSSFENLSKVKDGYVYVLSNPAWPEWVKVGMAIDANDRCGSYQTSSPYRDYVLHHAVASDDRRVAEYEAHTALEKVADSRRGEWFKIPVDKAVECMTGITK